MTLESFKNSVKNELKSGRTVPPIELLQYEIIARENRLEFEYILLAIQFAKLIKGTSVHGNYIKAIINDWLSLNLRTTSAVKHHLETKNKQKITQKQPEKHHYTPKQFNTLFDDVKQVVL